MRNPFPCLNSSPGVIRLTVIMYVRYPLSLRQVEDLLLYRGIYICHETVRLRWNRFRYSNPRGIGRHLSSVDDSFSGHIDEFRIAHVRPSDRLIETTWNSPGAWRPSA